MAVVDVRIQSHLYLFFLQMCLCICINYEHVTHMLSSRCFLSVSLCARTALHARVCPSRGHFPLQRLWHLVPQREEPASAPHVLLRQPAEAARRSLVPAAGQAQGVLPQRAHLPLPTVQQELPQCQLTRDPHAHPQR